MTKNYKFFIFLIFIILSSSLVFSVPPFQTITTPSGTLNIIYPKIDVYPLNSDIKLEFHVYNSTGYFLSNASTSCDFHAYNSTGNHLMDENLKYDVDSGDFYINLNDSISMNEGKYSYLLHCNNSEAGFISIAFEMRTSDVSSPFELTYLVALLCLVSFVVFVMFFFKHIQLKEHWFLKIFLQFIILIMGFVALFLGYLALKSTGIAHLIQLGDIFIFIIWSVLTVLLLYYIYYMVERSVKEWKK